ncbi:ABC-type nitrate/sulfonate/bicarbonate transport system substrate-binding protein [Methylohalomonas lacus]|uniref:ABC-type nitrate/sulfonate/bicarbonate transport system substrate-binding protein n=1 Tax=Methylohalomonas lacus TaxID=398773 RepID=A0AAE3HKA0_9GAMM|nr:ABC transporter substrate-binding protein [Methylohalomonas lacus]MCS3902452.1 ABC-type nitrate/sulfonate/bicarbonate transport system substrate-binding protein [Methylohalomonas lacus]
MTASPHTPGSWLIAVLVLLLIRPPPVSADNSSTMRLSGVDYLGDLPTLIADRNGHFQQSGLAIEVQYTDSGKANLQRLRNGRVDYALMALTPLVIDTLEDNTPGEPNDPVILASLVHASHFNHVVTLAERIQTARALQGGRVGMAKGTNAELVWWLFSAYHKLDKSAITLVDYPIDKLPQALLNGAIDAAVMWQPWVAKLSAQADTGLLKLPGSNVYTAKWLLVSRREVVDQHPEVTRTLLNAYQAAIDDIARNPDAVLQQYADRAGIDAQHFADSWQNLAYALNLDWSLITTFQQQQAWAYQMGYGDGHPSGPSRILPLLAPAALRSIAPSAVGLPLNMTWQRSLAPE